MTFSTLCFSSFLQWLLSLGAPRHRGHLVLAASFLPPTRRGAISVFLPLGFFHGAVRRRGLLLVLFGGVVIRALLLLKAFASKSLFGKGEG